MKYPVGPKTIKQALNTEAGKLAALLNRVLYSADHAEVVLDNSAELAVRRWVAMEEVYRHDDALPDSVPVAGHSGKYFRTEELMRAIRDYLEWESLRQVIP